MSEVVLEISAILSHLIKKSGISEAALGREIDVPRATINRLVSGKTPDPRASTLKAIATYFNVTVDQLLGKQPLFTHTSPATRSDPYPSIPLIDWNHAKNWKSALKRIKPDNHFDWILTDPNIDTGKFALRVKGESMWPQFQENTLLIIDPTKKNKKQGFCHSVR